MITIMRSFLLNIIATIYYKNRSFALCCPEIESNNRYRCTLIKEIFIKNRINNNNKLFLYKVVKKPRKNLIKCTHMTMQIEPEYNTDNYKEAVSLFDWFFGTPQEEEACRTANIE